MSGKPSLVQELTSSISVVTVCLLSVTCDTSCSAVGSPILVSTRGLRKVISKVSPGRGVAVGQSSCMVSGAVVLLAETAVGEGHAALLV